MSIQSVRALVDAEVNGQTAFATWRKSPTQVTGAGIWFDLSMSPGNPVPNYYAASPTVGISLNYSTDGGIYHGGNVSTAVKSILNASAFSAATTTAPAVLMLYDMLANYTISSVTTTGAQSFTGQAAWPRYADGKGVRAFLVPSVVMGAGTPTVQLSYTNTASTSGRLTPATPSLPLITTTSPVGAIPYTGTGVGKIGPFLPLASGDAGILSVQTINFSATMTSGCMNLVICRPLLFLPITTVGVASERDFLNMLPSLPIVNDGAVLCWAMYAGAATPVNSAFAGHLDFGWN